MKIQVSWEVNAALIGERLLTSEVWGQALHNVPSKWQ